MENPEQNKDKGGAAPPSQMQLPPVPNDADFNKFGDMNNLDDSEVIFKVVMVGDQWVGKTSLVKRYVVNEFEKAEKSTIGGTFLSKSIEIDNVNVKLQIWDTAGQDKYRVLQSIYYRGAVGAFIVFDVSNRQSWERVQKGWLEQVREQGDIGIMIMILGNKCDKPDEDRYVQSYELKEYALQNQTAYYETSAKQNLNVEEAFSTMARGKRGIQKQALFEQYRGRPSNPKPLRAASIQLDRRSIGPMHDLAKGEKANCCQK